MPRPINYNRRAMQAKQSHISIRQAMQAKRTKQAQRNRQARQDWHTQVTWLAAAAAFAAVWYLG